MANLTKILSEYAKLRQTGKDAKTAFANLRDTVQQLNAQERDTLLQRLRSWEASVMGQEVDTTQPERPQIKKISQQPANADETISTSDKVACPNCGKMNLKNEAICFSCGALLDAGRSRYSTRTIIDGEGAIKDDFFGANSTLVLQVHGTEQIFRLQPQMISHEIIIGRNTKNSPVMPDIDLSSVGADEMGVSRMHLGLRYDAKHNSINIYDMGSANGSFLNEQRIHPQEVRILHHGDAMRLGALILVAYFEHLE
jgi:ribosomal protein L32